jgi:N utilization substance protein B
MQALFQWDVQGDDFRRELPGFIEQSSDDPQVREYAARLAGRTWAHRLQIDDLIGSVAEHWELSRLAAVDRALLRLALCEMLHVEDVPAKVSIDEAIALARRFGTEQSGSFVNGVLDAACRRIAATGQAPGGPKTPEDEKVEA